MKSTRTYVAVAGLLLSAPAFAQPAPTPIPTPDTPFAGLWCPANERGEDMSEAPEEAMTIDRNRLETLNDSFEITDFKRTGDDVFLLTGVWNPESTPATLRLTMRGESFIALNGAPRTEALYIRCKP